MKAGTLLKACPLKVSAEPGSHSCPDSGRGRREPIIDHGRAAVRIGRKSATGKTGNSTPDYYSTPRHRRINPELIPQELRDLRPMGRVAPGEAQGQVDEGTIPSRNPSRKASTTDPGTWGNFDEAMAAFLEHEDIDGIGFVFSADGPYAGIDFDNCFGPDGAIAEWALARLERFKGGWAAISPSGQGIKVIVRGNLGGKTGTNRKGFGPDGKGGNEVAVRPRPLLHDDQRCPGRRPGRDRGRALRRTPRPCTPRPTRKATKVQPAARQQAAEVLSLDDGALVERIRRSKQGDKFSALYDRGDTSGHHGNDSQADFALCCILAFWTNKDAGRIERLFNGSRL